MNIPKSPKFVKVWLIGAVLATIMCMGIFAHAQPPMKISVVGKEIQCPGACQDVFVYIRVDNVPTPPPGAPTPPLPDQAVMAMQFSIKYDPDCLELVSVERSILTKATANIEKWAIQWNDVESQGNSIGECSVALAHDPSMPGSIPQDCWENENCDPAYPPNQRGVYYLPGDGNILKVTFHVIGDCLSNNGDCTDLELDSVLINEGEIVPVVVDGEICCGDCPIPWTVTPTPSVCNFHGTAQINGVPAEPGDVIGAFVSDVVINDGCVGIFELVHVPGHPGVYGVMSVYGDDTSTVGIKDGAVAGDTIIFKILDRSECEVCENVLAVGDTTWTPGVTKEVDLTCTKVFELRLAEGWNLISWPSAKCFYQDSVPTDPLPAGTQTIDINTLGYTSMAAWFTSMVIPNTPIGETPWSVVMGAHPGGAATVMDSSLPPFLHTLKYMSAGYGYWVKMKDGTNGGTITLAGSLLAPDATLSLAGSWNLVGFLPTIGYYDTAAPPGANEIYATPTCWIQKPAPVTDYVLSSIAGKWLVVMGARPGGAAIVADSALPPFLYTLHDFVNGNGYWIKTSKACNLSYPSDSCGDALIAMSPGMYDISYSDVSVKPTNRSMFVHGMVSLDGNPAPVGSNITVWTSNGVFVGEGTVKRTGVYGLFPIYGNDLTTDEVDGALIDEELIVKVNGHSASSTIRWLGERTIQRVDLASQTRIIPSVSWLGQNYPNPFNPETWFPYALSESAKVTVQIYDMNGSLVQTLNLGEKSAGVYDTKELAAYWNGRNYTGERVSSGLYFYKLTAGQFTQVKRMVILK